MTTPAPPVLGAFTSALLLRLAGRIVPEITRATPDTRRVLIETVNAALRLRPTGQQWEFRAMVLGLGVVTAPLPAKWQDTVLRYFEGAPLTILRVGVWGLKTLVFMGYYSQQAVIAGICYAPSMRCGNTILHRMHADQTD